MPTLWLQQKRSAWGDGTEYVFDLVDSYQIMAAVTLETGVFDATLIEQQLWFGNSTQVVAFYSPRLATAITMSGTVTFKIAAGENNDTTNAALRARLFKVTHGGSHVETLIGQADSAELPTTSALQAFSFTISPSMALAENERLILRLYAIPASGQTAGSGVVTVNFNGMAGTITESWIEFSDAVTFKANATRLLLRRTSVAGIGAFFDMLTTRGSSAFTTGVVNTVAGGTEIQWTRTAGGTVLEWISPRFREGWWFGNPDVNTSVATIGVWAYESATAANAGWRVKLFHRRGSTETECYVGSDPTELTTSVTSRLIISTQGTVTPMGFLPDDRLVMRMYLVNIGTMGGSRTATVNYDTNAAGMNGDSYVELLGVGDLKAEADAATPSTVPDGLSTMGLGN